MYLLCLTVIFDDQDAIQVILFELVISILISILINLALFIVTTIPRVTLQRKKKKKLFKNIRYPFIFLLVKSCTLTRTF